MSLYVFLNHSSANPMPRLSGDEINQNKETIFLERDLDTVIMRCIFSRVLHDSTPCFVGPSVGPSLGPSIGPSVCRSVRQSITLYFFGVNGGFGLIAPAQMFH